VLCADRSPSREGPPGVYFGGDLPPVFHLYPACISYLTVRILGIPCIPVLYRSISSHFAADPLPLYPYPAVSHCILICIDIYLAILKMISFCSRSTATATVTVSCCIPLYSYFIIIYIVYYIFSVCAGFISKTKLQELLYNI